jgi:hypothetical protein
MTGQCHDESKANLRGPIVVEIAVVGLGAWGLCVLERTISRARRTDQSIRLHGIEPGVLGGIPYGPSQPDYLVLNNACGQLSLYAAYDEEQTPKYGLSLCEWAQRTGYHWVGDECRLDPSGRPIDPGDYLPRRLMGEYLAWFYETALAELPPNLEFIRHHAGALDILADARDRERILLDNGESLVVHHVIMTSGHTPNLAAEAGGSSPIFREPYPVSALAPSPAPGEPVTVAGLGLVGYDVIAAFTSGRGGQFIDHGSRMTYVASGREPSMTVYSRSGIPYCAKSITGTDPTGDYRPVVCTPDVFATIRGEQPLSEGRIARTRRAARRQADLRQDLLPLLFAEMRARYYIQSASNAGGAGTADEVRTVLRNGWVSGEFDAATERLSTHYGTFDPADHMFAGHDQTYDSAADYEKRFYALVADDLDEALVLTGSPVKAAQETLRILRDEIRSVVEFGGLSLTSYIDFSKNIKGRINRLEAGPPVMRSKQLLALMDAGLVRAPFGPAPEVTKASAERNWVSSTQLETPYRAQTTSVIRGYLDMPSLARSASPLLTRLYTLGRLTQLQYGTQAVGSVAISEDFHPYDIEGRVQRNISLFGVLTEGARYFTHYIPSPRSRIRAVLDAQACIDAILGT